MGKSNNIPRSYFVRPHRIEDTHKVGREDGKESVVKKKASHPQALIMEKYLPRNFQMLLPLMMVFKHVRFVPRTGRVAVKVRFECIFKWTQVEIKHFSVLS